MNKSRDRFRDLCFVAALSALVVVAFWIVLPQELGRNESSDFLSFYDPVAHNLLDGRGFTLPDGRPAILYPPGFTLYITGLLAIGRASGLSENFMLMAASLVAMVLGSILVYCIARLYWDQSEARLATLAWTTYPLGLWLTKQPSAEAPFIVLLYGAVLMSCRELARAGRVAAWISVGALTGLAMLIRPVAIGIPFVLAAILLIKGTDALSRRILLAACMMASSILVILPWEIWLHRTEGRFILLGSVGATTMRDGLVFGVHLKGYRERILLPADVEQMMMDLEGRRQELTSQSALVAAVVDHFKRAPITVAKLFFLKALRSCYATDSRRMDSPLILIQFVYFAAILLSGVRAWRGNTGSHLVTTVIWSIVAYFWVMDIVSAAIVRYMVPAFGLLFVNHPGLWAEARQVDAPRRPFEIAKTLAFSETSQVL